jgi:excisionase family DNA binding protein
MNDVVEPRLARLGTAGQMLGISESAVRRLIRQGELRTVKLTADLRIPIAEIDALIARKLSGDYGDPSSPESSPSVQP